MKKLMFAVATLACFGVASAADKTPNMLGEWSNAEAYGTVMGYGSHHPKDEAKPDFRSRSYKISFVVDQQEGRQFAGRIVSDVHTEKFVGALTPDGKSGVMADEDGVYQFKLVGGNALEYCYSHTTKDLLIAACNKMTRK